MSNPLTRWDKAIVATLAVVIVGFGTITTIRSALLTRPMTDAQVYFRAAWAVRAGIDPYVIGDENNWHFVYPPAVAVAFLPFADAPPTQQRPWYMPNFAALVEIWYALSLTVLFWGIHRLATACEETLLAQQPAPRYGQRWLRLRLWPLLVCLGPVGMTLGRGQINLILVALFCAATAAILRGRHGPLGAWLGVAAGVKIIPAFLLLLPVLRFDRKAIMAAAGVLLISVVIIPVLAFGPTLATEYTRELIGYLAPAADLGGEENKLAKELTTLTTTHSQSIPGILHKWLYWDVPTWLQPPRPSANERTTHYAAAAFLTLVSAVVILRRRRVMLAEAMGLQLLVLVMLIISPVSHQHYFCFAIPLFLLQTARVLRGEIGRRREIALGLTFAVATSLPYLPAYVVLREAGSALFVTILLWAVTVVRVWRLPAAAIGTVESKLAA